MIRTESSSTKNSNLPVKDEPSFKEDKKLGKTLSIATAIMMGSVLLSRITGLLREQVIAHYGGTGISTDAYVSAFLIPELLNHFLAGGFLSVTFIPIFQRYLLRGDRERAWATFSNLICIGSLFFLILIPLSIIFTPDILRLMGVAESAKPLYFQTTVRLTRIILPAQILFYWGAFFSAVQMAEKRFFIPAIAPLCYNGGIILGGILLGTYIGIDGFAWGVLGGAFLANLVVQLPGAYKLGMKFHLKFNFRDSDLLEYVKKSIPLVLGLGMTFSNEIFFRFFAASLSEGVVSSVNYALRVMMMVVAIFGQASGAAFYPFLTKMALEKQFDAMNEMLNSLLTKVAVFLLPVSGLMIVLSEPVIAIVYQRGSFDYQSTLQTASIFSVYLVGALGFSASMIVSRSFYAMQNTVLPMVISTLTAILSIPCYILFSHKMGGTGIALATVLSVTSQFIILYCVWCTRYSRWRYTASLLLSFSKILVICALGCGLAYLLKTVSVGINMQIGLFRNLTICFICTVPSMLLIFLLYQITGIQKFSDILRKILRRK